MTPDISVDELFRQRTLQEIHVVLKQTRADVESKKQELRELVGDHYRSVLESSDHIRAMSAAAAEISAGADRVDELLASMQQLAASPPAAGTAVAPKASEEADHDYRVGLRVMELLEVPESVRGHLGAHEFVHAARIALVDAATMKAELDELLTAGGSCTRSAGFDVKALVRQQSLAFRGLPKQIAASCLDAFAAPRLEAGSAAEAFVVHLLLDTLAQPVPLLRLFLDRRVELLRNLSSSTSAFGRGGCASRLTSAATAFEGTVFLGSALCEGGAPGRPSPLAAALQAVSAGLPERMSGEDHGAGEIRRRVDRLRPSLVEPAGADALAVELARLGGQMARELAPGEASGGAALGAAGGPRTFAAMLERIASGAVGSELRTCKDIGEAHRICADRVLAYRRSLLGAAQGDWDAAWRRACKAFCPSWSRPSDALALLAASVELVCAQVARERVSELQLDLVLAADEDGDAVVSVGTSLEPGAALADEGDEGRRRDELAEIGREARLRLTRFDEQLAEVIADVEAAGAVGASVAVAAAMLDALEALLNEACSKVYVPTVPPVWSPGPAAGGGAATRSEPAAPWRVQRSAARAAAALEVLHSAAAAAEEPSRPHLWRALRGASAAGDPRLAARARAVADNLQERSATAYRAWARLAVSGSGAGAGPGAMPSSLAAFWRLAEDEVVASCGWGSACFAGKAGGSAIVGDKKAVPVPVQASPFAFELLSLGARRALEVTCALGIDGLSDQQPPAGLTGALKLALSEAFLAAYTAETMDLEKMKKTSMNQLLQWLFDLHFIRLALSSTPSSSSARGSGAAAAGSNAYDALRTLLDKSEAVVLSDPVDRLLYQEVLKSSVRSHVQGVRILLAPLFLDNPLYGFRFQSGRQPGIGEVGSTSGSLSAAAKAEAEGFELQPSKHQPFRQVVPRFPLLPVAMGSSFDLSSRLDAATPLASSTAAAGAAGLAGIAGSGVASGADIGAASAAAAAAAESLMKQVGSGLGSLGLGKFPIGSSWATGWSASGTGARPPEAV